MWAESAGFTNAAEPFPTTHRHTFSYPLDRGDVNNFWYVNPGTCLRSAEAQPYGYIRVVGR